MAITMSEQNWLALQSASTIPADLIGLMSIMRDNRASEQNVRLSLEQIRKSAQFVADFCVAAIERLPEEGRR